MALLPADLFDPAVFIGGRSNTPLPLAAAFIAVAIGLRVLRARGHGRSGPTGGPAGGSTATDVPMQWDIRKPPEPEATPETPPDTTAEQQDPPGDR